MPVDTRLPVVLAKTTLPDQWELNSEICCLKCRSTNLQHKKSKRISRGVKATEVQKSRRGGKSSQLIATLGSALFYNLIFLRYWCADSSSFQVGNLGDFWHFLNFSQPQPWTFPLARCESKVKNKKDESHSGTYTVLDAQCHSLLISVLSVRACEAPSLQMNSLTQRAELNRWNSEFVIRLQRKEVYTHQTMYSEAFKL